MQKQASEIVQKICRGRDGFGYAELQTLGLRLVCARLFGGQKHLVTSRYKTLHLTLSPVTASYCNLPQFTAIYRDIPPPGNSVALGRLRGYFSDVTYLEF